MSGLQHVRNGLQRHWSIARSWYRRQMSLGARGERVAARFLKRRQFQILETQTRNLFGEIDIIAVEKRTVVFVEVKTRQGLNTGHPTESVTPEKQRRITRVALAYLRQHQLLETPVRFDVVAVVWPPNTRRPTVEHYRNAFPAVGRFQLLS